MGLYDHWPYTNFHELNLSWLLRRMEYLSNVVENFVALNTIKYADPIQWNITSQYETNTVVVDPQTGTAYLSSRPVPPGVGLTNTDYWSVIFTLDVISANKNITLRDDGSNVLSTFSSAAGDWLLWNGTLYKVTQGINVNEAYVVGYNLTRYTVEMFVKDYIGGIIANIGDLADLDTTDQSTIVNAINEVYNIAKKVTTTQIYNVKDYGATGDGLTDDTAAINDAIDDCNLTGGILFFPTGNYLVTGPLNAFTEPTTIMGNLSEINATLASTSDYLFTLSTDSIIEDMHIKANQGCIIKTAPRVDIFNVIFNTATRAIHIDNSLMCRIERCYFIHIDDVAIDITSDSVDTGDNHVMHCVFDGTGDPYTAIRLVSGGGLNISNNKFLYLNSCLTEAIDTPATSVLIFNNNSCEYIGVAVIRFMSDLNVMPYAKCIIDGNQILAERCLQILDYSDNIHFTNNFCQYSGTGNVYAFDIGKPGTGIAPTNVGIRNNNFQQFYGILFLYVNSPYLTFRDNTWDVCPNPINGNAAGVSGEIDMNFLIRDKLPTNIGSATQEYYLQLFPYQTVKVRVSLTDRPSDYIEGIITANDTTGTLTTLQGSINNKLAITVTGLAAYIVVNSTSIGSAAIKVEVDGCVKHLQDLAQ